MPGYHITLFSLYVLRPPSPVHRFPSSVHCPPFTVHRPPFSVLRTPFAFRIIYCFQIASSIKVYLVGLISGCLLRHLQKNKLLTWPVSIPDIWFYFSCDSVPHLLSVVYLFMSVFGSVVCSWSFRCVNCQYCRSAGLVCLKPSGSKLLTWSASIPDLGFWSLSSGRICYQRVRSQFQSSLFPCSLVLGYSFVLAPIYSLSSSSARSLPFWLSYRPLISEY